MVTAPISFVCHTCGQTVVVQAPEHGTTVTCLNCGREYVMSKTRASSTAAPLQPIHLPHTLERPKLLFDYTDVIDLLYNEDISGWFKNNEGGKRLQALQGQFASFLGSKYAYAVSSGNASIYVALKALEVKTGDLIAVPAYTHIGTVAPIILAGGWPVFVDVDIHDGNISRESLLHSIQMFPKIKGVIIVHQLGKPCDYDGIVDVLGDKHPKFLVEDASHALGSFYNKHACGTLGHIGCFSIGGGRTKIVGTGEGGMVVTDDPQLAEKIKNIRNHGDRNADVPYFCFNFRMSELNAAVGLEQFRHIKDLVVWQVERAKYIIDHLPEYLEYSPILSSQKETFTNQYLIGCHWISSKAGMSRDEFLSRMQKAGYDGGVPRMNISGGYSKLVPGIKYYVKRRIALHLENSEYLVKNAVWIDWHRYPRTIMEGVQLLENIRKVVGR